MARRSDPLEALTDLELEIQFVEAERNALAWATLGAGARSDARGSRWMQIAGALRAEMLRRTPVPKPPKRPKRPKRP